MLGLFGKKNKKPAKKSPAKTGGKKQSREQIIAEAMSNVRTARAEIGEEALDQIAAALKKRENSEMEKARNKIKSLDQERVADNIRAMLYDDE